VLKKGPGAPALKYRVVAHASPHLSTPAAKSLKSIPPERSPALIPLDLYAV